jgi:hypothetical protein
MPTKKKKTSRTPIADLDAPPSLACLTDKLVGEGDLFWHDKIRSILADAGFDTDRIEREDYHPIWKLWTRRKTFALAPETEIAIAQIRTVLNKGGIRLKRDEFNIIDWRKDKLHCVFMFNYGAPGVWQAPPRQTKKQAELWPARH